MRKEIEMLEKLKKLKELPIRKKILISVLYVFFYILAITIAPKPTAVLLAYGPLIIPVVWLFFKRKNK